MEGSSLLGWSHECHLTAADIFPERDCCGNCGNVSTTPLNVNLVLMIPFDKILKLQPKNMYLGLSFLVDEKEFRTWHHMVPNCKSAGPKEIFCMCYMGQTESEIVYHRYMQNIYSK